MTEDESSKRLQQLLRLKRHETPPPGYFNDLSSGVMDRIRALEAERNTPLWRRWFFSWIRFSECCRPGRWAVAGVGLERLGIGHDGDVARRDLLGQWHE